MKKILFSILFSATSYLLFSCSSSTVNMALNSTEQERSIAANKLLKTSTCEELIARAHNSDDALNHLAALYAEFRQCPGFSFDKSQLTDKELKIFSAVFNLNKTYNPSFKIPRPNVFANPPAWTNAWALYKNGDKKAEMALNEIIKNTDNLSEKSRALFFLGKLYKKQNRLIESRQSFEAAANNDFYSYHALAAHYELGRPLAPISLLLNSPLKSFSFDPKLTFLAQDDFRLFIELMKNEEYGMLDRTCFAFEKTWNDCANMGIYLAEKAKYYHMLHFSFSYVSDADKRDLFIRYSHFLYPMMYNDKVKQMSLETGTPTSLIYAIIKQESSFRPYIVNSVPAYGLMQLTPESAEYAAKSFNFSAFDKRNLDSLFNPQINIPLGTYELTTRIRQYKGQLTYVGIAYNAGPRRVQDWKKIYSTADMFEFIEDIPFWETRNYVKMGARNMLFYQRLAEPNKEFYFPKEFIEIEK